MNFEIPPVDVRRIWPHFDEDADRESLASSVSEVDSLWAKTSRLTSAIDDTDFFGPTAAYTTIDGPIDERGDARIAVANFYHLQECFKLELSRACWHGVATTPPAGVLLQLLVGQFGTAAFDAANILRFDGDHVRAIKRVEQQRASLVAVVTATIEMFFASTEALANRPDRPRRNDEPDEDEIAIARQVCRANPSITRDGLAKQLKIGGTKATRLLDVMREEGLVTSRRRKSRAK